MPSDRQQLIFDLLLGRDTASAGLSKTGKAAGVASDDVQRLSDRLDAVGDKSAEARISLKGDTEAEAALDRLDLKIAKLDGRVIDDRITIEGAAKAAVDIGTVDAALDKLKLQSEDTAGSDGKTGLSALIGNTGTPSGLTGLITAGVILSPVLLTLGTGLGGLTLAAAGMVKPIENAAQATGGLAANLKSLDPEQQQVAKGLLSLQQDFGSFEKAVEPAVMDDFSKGLQLAEGLLKDIEPVTLAVGKAFGQFLGQLSANFQGSTWQQFFQFMGSTAQPDMQALGGAFIDLADDIPPVVEALQPLALAFLRLTDDIAQAVHGLEDFNQKATDAVNTAEKKTGGPGNFFSGFVDDVRKFITLDWGKASSGQDQVAKSTTGLSTAAGHAATNLQDVFTQVTNLHDAEQSSLATLTKYNDAIIAQYNSAGNLNKALDQSHDKIGLNTAAQRNSFTAADQYITNTIAAAKAAGNNSSEIDQVITSIKNELPHLEDVTGGTRQYWQEVRTLVNYLDTLRRERDITEQITVTGKGQWAVSEGIQRQIPGPRAAAGAFITQGTSSTADDVIARVSKGEVIVPAGMVKAGAVDHLKGAIPGFASGGVVGSYSGAVSGLPPFINKENTDTVHSIAVSVAAAVKQALSGGGSAIAHFAEQFATGNAHPYVWGGTSPSGWDCSGFTGFVYNHFGYSPPRTSEDQYHWSRHTGDQPGALAFFISPAGGPPPGHVGISLGNGWMVNAEAPGIGTVESRTTGALAFGIPPSGFRGQPSLGTAGGGSDSVIELGRAMAAARGWTGVEWTDLFDLWQRESGWNPNARNPSSGAAGIPQDITGNFHGGAQGQIAWGLNYIGGRYGDPVRAWQHELADGWYGNGLQGGIFTKPTLIGVGDKGPERVDVTPIGAGASQKIVVEFRSGGGSDLERALIGIVQKYVIVHGGDAQVALGQRA